MIKLCYIQVSVNLTLFTYRPTVLYTEPRQYYIMKYLLIIFSEAVGDGAAAVAAADGAVGVAAVDSAAAAAAWTPIPSTSTMPMGPSTKDSGMLYLVDEEEAEHIKMKRKLEIQLLEEQIEAQKAIKLAMQNLAEMCASKTNK